MSVSDFITIGNDEGLRVSLCSYGASIVSVQFPDQEGNMQECVLGYENKEGYITDKCAIGKTIGRVANRVLGGLFNFQGVEYILEQNNETECLHGGSNGLSNRDWELIESFPTSCRFKIHTDESIDMFPGDANIEVTYTVNDLNQLVVEHTATCTKPGVLSLTNHAYWNLDEESTIANHQIELTSTEYLPVDEKSRVLGSILSVKCSKFDLNNSKPLSIFNDELGIVDVDNDFVLNEARNKGENVLRFSSDKSGIELSVSTSYPAVHLYGGKYLSGICRGGNLTANAGLAIEPSFYSSSTNFSHFPSIDLVPGQRYSHEIIYTLGHKNNTSANTFPE